MRFATTCSISLIKYPPTGPLCDWAHIASDVPNEEIYNQFTARQSAVINPSPPVQRKLPKQYRMVARRPASVVADASIPTTRSTRKRAACRESMSPVRKPKNQARQRSVAPAAAAAAAARMPQRPHQAAPLAIAAAAPKSGRRSERLNKITDSQMHLPVRTQLRARQAGGTVDADLDRTKLYMRPGTMMNEVFERALKENVGTWNKREAGMDSDYDVDYIVASQVPRKGEVFPTRSGKVLMKWSGFPVPREWENLGDNMDLVIAEYTQKLSFEDSLELKLRKRMGNMTFNKTFPNRFLVPENDKSNSGYVRDELALEKNRLAAIAHDWSVLSGVQIFIIDWTSMPSASTGLKELIFLLKTQRTPTVKRILDSGMQKSLSHIACTAACTHCEYSEDVGAAHNCCAMPSTIERDNKGNVRFVKKGVKESRKAPYYFECSDLCECDKLRCKNRSVQNGRTKPLAVVRLPLKDWALFAVEPFAMDEFVTEYIGQMNLGHSRSPKDRCYDFTLLYDALRKDGPNRPFVVNSAKIGNEGRFTAHSCEPNMYVAQVIVERDGECLNRIAFYAQANIEIGNELTVDYFPDETLEDSYAKVINFFGETGCACRSKMCRFSEKLIKKYNDNNNSKK